MRQLFSKFWDIHSLTNTDVHKLTRRILFVCFVFDRFLRYQGDTSLNVGCRNWQPYTQNIIHLCIWGKYNVNQTNKRKRFHQNNLFL
jgi:hypothetical protein